MSIPTNIVVQNSKWTERDIQLLFGDEEVHFTSCENIETLLKELGVYQSISGAKRDGRVGPLPIGFTFAYKASKKHRIWIWNPDE